MYCSVKRSILKGLIFLFCNKIIFSLILFIFEKNIECCVNVDLINKYLFYWEIFIYDIDFYYNFNIK